MGESIDKDLVNRNQSVRRRFCYESCSKVTRLTNQCGVLKQVCEDIDMIGKFGHPATVTG
jgi:hypothetical protein